jgi:hypothetical protein
VAKVNGIRDIHIFRDFTDEIIQRKAKLKVTQTLKLNRRRNNPAKWLRRCAKAAAGAQRHLRQSGVFENYFDWGIPDISGPPSPFILKIIGAVARNRPFWRKWNPWKWAYRAGMGDGAFDDVVFCVLG